ncbi:MAG: thioredoxin [Ardenticatenaceae bacterium]|nr:thioredoxin [Ardenticatenaceae bacterium]MCB9443210.1 thioredoxin [Ardenticatenaceae bacterium]
MKLFSFFKKDKAARRAAIIDVSDANFEQQVIRRSYKSPVLVDFWAEWCMPCRQLGPVLEKLAEEPDGEFILAKLNTENNRRTAVKYSIQSIPNVKMFRNGQVVDEFTGAMPMGLVRRFIAKQIKTPPPPPAIKGSNTPAQRIKQAEQHLKKGRGFEAFILLDNFPPGNEENTANTLFPLARFLFDMEDGDGLTGLEALDRAYQAAANALRQRKPDQALAQLLTALGAGEDIDQSYTLQVIDSLFALLGENHPITKQYREQVTAVSPPA